MDKPENPYAFPHLEPREPSFSYCDNGMTLRDWFAGQALAGTMVGNFSADSLSPQAAAHLAEEAYRVADAMLASRTIEKDNM